MKEIGAWEIGQHMYRPIPQFLRPAFTFESPMDTLAIFFAIWQKVFRSLCDSDDALESLYEKWPCMSWNKIYNALMLETAEPITPNFLRFQDP